VSDRVEYDVRVRPVSSARCKGDWTIITNYRVIGKDEEPSNVTGFGASINDFGIRFHWDKVPDLDVLEYEIRTGTIGATWDTSDFLARTGGTNHTANIQVANDYQFLIKARDTSLNYSLEATALIASITGPEAPVTTLSVSGINVLLRWGIPNGLFAIDSYEIAYGTPATPYEDRTIITSTKGLSYSEKITFAGTRVYWVTAIDVAGNYGTPYATQLTIQAPGVVTNTIGDVIDNNVLLKWAPPSTGSLPIDYYQVYKGDVFDTATLVGQVGGTFSALFEIVSGTYTYWIVAIDTAGTNSSPSPVTVIVNQPPDFVLLEDQILDMTLGSGIRYNVIEAENAILLPINEFETWSEHFTSNGWTTIQDIIDEGFIFFIEPAVEAGYWQQTIDYGAVVGSALINCSYSRIDYHGTVSLRVFIAYSLDGSSWTEQEASQVYGTNFQFVRIRLQVGTLPGGTGEMIGMLGITYP